MRHQEIKALLSLLDDDDTEVRTHIEDKILSMGDVIIPFLENEWENSLNPKVQNRIEDLIHNLQLESTEKKLYEWKKEHQDDLLRGLWAVATYQYPDLSLEQLQSEIDQIYYRIWMLFKEDMHPSDQIKVINYVLYDEVKLVANTKHFHSPANSMLNEVLRTKKGNPLSLCALYILLAQKLSLPIFGVNLPNLFILTYQTENVQFYINAFNRGLIFTKEDIDNYLAQINLTPSDRFYTPCTNRDIIVRLLRNLIISFETLGETQKVLEVKHFLSLFEVND
ncbi:MAG: transglutaminase-like domain-containing protein [Thermonemataceae bacterium]